MNRVHPHLLGLVFAVFLGVWHGLWAFLVWAGAAQWLLDFVFQLHMIAPAYHVAAFSLFTATALVLLTAATGYAFGWFMAFVWNQFVARPTTNWRLEQQGPKHAD